MTSNIEDLGILHSVLMPLEMQEWLLDISIHHFYTKTIKYLYKSINSMLDVTKNMHYNFGVLGLLLILINFKSSAKSCIMVYGLDELQVRRKAEKIEFGNSEGKKDKSRFVHGLYFRILKGHCAMYMVQH